LDAECGSFFRSQVGFAEAVGELFEYVVVAESQPGLLQDPDAAAQIDLAPIVGLHGTAAIQLTGIGTSVMGEQGEIGRANVGADTRTYLTARELDQRRTATSQNQKQPALQIQKRPEKDESTFLNISRDSHPASQQALP